MQQISFTCCICHRPLIALSARESFLDFFPPKITFCHDNLVRSVPAQLLVVMLGVLKSFVIRSLGRCCAALFMCSRCHLQSHQETPLRGKCCTCSIPTFSSHMNILAILKISPALSIKPPPPPPPNMPPNPELLDPPYPRLP